MIDIQKEKQANEELIKTAAVAWKSVKELQKMVEKDRTNKNLQHEFETAKNKYSEYLEAYKTYVPTITPEKFLDLVEKQLANDKNN